MCEREERLLPYSAEQLFDLAADVERYPEFLSWWLSAHVWKWQGKVYYTDQVLGLGPIRVHFSSKTVLRRPDRIDVTADNSQFRRFSLSWTFEARPGVGCLVRLAADLELHSYLLQRVVEHALPAAMDDIVAAFEGRAHWLYGMRNQRS